MSPFAPRRPGARLATYSLRLYPATRAALDREAARRESSWTAVAREIIEREMRMIGYKDYLE